MNSVCRVAYSGRIYIKRNRISRGAARMMQQGDIIAMRARASRLVSLKANEGYLAYYQLCCACVCVFVCTVPEGYEY